MAGYTEQPSYEKPLRRLVEMKKLLLIVIPLLLIAGTAGKISGTVVDAGTGQPLVGVDVYIDELHMGGATDIDGNYYILNVPPGRYDVEVSMMGYRTEIRQGVGVVADRTSYVDFRLSEAVIEIEQPVIVIAEKPIIEIDMTSKETRVTREDLDALPIDEPIEVITLQGGVTTDAAGGLHIRGGRTGELAYYIDGIEVSNALLGSTPFLHKDIISEMSFLSGTFNAEYGNIMSGVVNIVTPEGGSKFTTSFEYESWMLNESVYRQADWIDSASDAHRDSLGNSLYEQQDILDLVDIPFLGEVNGNIAGPFPFDKNTRFFVSGQYRSEESYLPFGYDIARSVHGKVNRRFGNNFKMFCDVHYLDHENQHYSHRYKYLFENYLINVSKSMRTLIGMNHAPTSTFYYNVRGGYIRDDFKTSVPDLPDSVLEEPISDNNSEFYISGYPVYWQHALTDQYIVKADFNMQAWKNHNLKWGVEHNIYMFELEKREQMFPRAPIAYQDYQQEPMDGAVYIQDKIEHRYLVVNAGLRFDYYDPRAEMWEDIEDPTSEVSEVGMQYQISPRIGLSHPITENAMLHFAYGHFFQVPPYNVMYFNTQYISEPDSIPRYGLVGNPRINPQTTVAYEVGVKYAIREIYGIDVTLFLKDIKNLLATTEVRVFPYDYIIYTNQDFGSVQGIDITIQRRTVQHFGFSLNYTYQVARGNRSFPMQGFYDVYTGLPERMKEYYLDFDRRHTLAATIDIAATAYSGMNVNLRAASGLPYTPYISEGVVVEENSARMDWEYSLDVLAHYGIKVGRTVLDVFVKGINLTDHLNPRYVYAYTGEPWDSGEEFGGLMGSQDFIMDPSNVGPRRSIKAGIRVRFQ